MGLWYRRCIATFFFMIFSHWNIELESRLECHLMKKDWCLNSLSFLSEYSIESLTWNAILFLILSFVFERAVILEHARYKYVSKLTIKLLEEGFELQEHLLALRRYHFMELADWADLFIMSLWHHVIITSCYYTILLFDSSVPSDSTCILEITEMEHYTSRS